MIEGSFECEEGSSIAARKNKAIHQTLSSVALTLLNRPKTIQHRRSTRLFLHFFGVKLKAVKTSFQFKHIKEFSVKTLTKRSKKTIKQIS